MAKLEALDEEQVYMAQFMLENPRNWNMSDCGVGKTLSQIEAYHRGVMQGIITGRVVVTCPKTSMQTAWGDDIEKFNDAFGTNYTYSLAYNTNREEAFLSDTDFVIVNHDGIKWMEENFAKLTKANLQWLVLDEATAYKNLETARTKAALMVRELFEYRTAISGTPYAKSVTDAFAPTFIVDDGDHLGRSFYRFRAQVQDCSPQYIPNGKIIQKWTDKENAKDIITEALMDMSVRFELKLTARTEEITYNVEIPKKVRAAYDIMKEHGIYAEGEDSANAVNAAVKLNKMLQILTGSIYNDQGKAILVNTERYEFVCELVSQRADPCLVMYNWTHELEQLLKHAKKAKLKVAFINSKVSPKERTKIVHDFQKGLYDAVFAHPKTVAHSLTFTRGAAVIWSSPTNSPEMFFQGNKRVARRGQEKDNQIICIAAKNTEEEQVYEKLKDPLATQADILAVFSAASRGAITQ